jgi:hypothetical protein
MVEVDDPENGPEPTAADLDGIQEHEDHDAHSPAIKGSK